MEGEEGGIYQCDANSGHIGAIVHNSYISCTVIWESFVVKIFS